MGIDFKAGDPHNFNLRVNLVEGKTPLSLFKPRTIFWEYQFLDETSPLRALLRGLSDGTDIRFDKLLGNIVINSNDKFSSGEVLFFKSSNPGGEEWLRQYGNMLAICSIFGITDLHKDNALTRKDGVQLVDIECLFWDLKVPSETLLLPRTKDEIERSVLSNVGVKSLNQLKPKDVLSILLGVDEILNLFEMEQFKLERFFREQESEYSLHPIRILPKRTREYRLFFEGVSELESFFPEEQEQLIRGDIPYFFGYLNRREVYYYSRPHKPKEVLSFNNELNQKIARAFKSPIELLSPSRLKSLHKQIIAEVLKRLLDFCLLPYDSEELKIFLENGFLKFKTKDHALQFKI